MKSKNMTITDFMFPNAQEEFTTTLINIDFTRNNLRTEHKNSLNNLKYQNEIDISIFFCFSFFYIIKILESLQDTNFLVTLIAGCFGFLINCFFWLLCIKNFKVICFNDYDNANRTKILRDVNLICFFLIASFLLIYKTISLIEKTDFNNLPISSNNFFDSLLAFEKNQSILIKEFYIYVFFISWSNYFFTKTASYKNWLIILSILVQLFSIVFVIIDVNSINSNVKAFLNNSNEANKIKLGNFQINFYNEKAIQYLPSEILFSIAINILFIFYSKLQELISKSFFLELYKLKKYFSEPQEILNCNENSFQISIVNVTKEKEKKLFINKTLSNFLSLENNDLAATETIYTKRDEKSNRFENAKINNPKESDEAVVFNYKENNNNNYISARKPMIIKSNNISKIKTNYNLSSNNREGNFEDAAKKNSPIKKKSNFFFGYNSSIRNFAECISVYVIEDIFTPFFENVRTFNDVLVSLKRIKISKSIIPNSTTKLINYSSIKEEKSSHLNFFEKNSNNLENIKLDYVDIKVIDKYSLDLSKKEDIGFLGLNSYGKILGILNEEFICVGYFIVKNQKSFVKNFQNSSSVKTNNNSNNRNNENNNNNINIINNEKSDLNIDKSTIKVNLNSPDPKDIIIEDNNNKNNNHNFNNNTENIENNNNNNNKEEININLNEKGQVLPNTNSNSYNNENNQIQRNNQTKTNNQNNIAKNNPSSNAFNLKQSEISSVTSNSPERLFLLKIRYIASLDTIDFIFTDVTASKIALDLKSEMESKQKHSAKIAHEFKTPINSIIGLINKAKEDLKKIQKAENSGSEYNKKAIKAAPRRRLNLSSIEAELNLIQNLSNYTIYLINDLIQFSSLQISNSSAIVRISIEAINLREILEFCHNIAKALINCNQAKSSALKAVLQFDNLIQNYTIRSDEIRLKQMVLNLLSNSVKFTKRGQITLKAEISQAKNSIIISVIDTGLGIREADINKLFGENVMLKLGQQDQNMNRMGSGLGLSICKNLAQRLGIKISLESKKNVGSTFRLEIPCRMPLRMYTKESSRRVSLRSSNAGDSVFNKRNLVNYCKDKLSKDGSEFSCDGNGIVNSKESPVKNNLIKKVSEFSNDKSKNKTSSNKINNINSNKIKNNINVICNKFKNKGVNSNQKVKNDSNKKDELQKNCELQDESNDFSDDSSNFNENNKIQNENAEIFNYQSNFYDPLIHLKKSNTQIKPFAKTNISNRINDYDIIYYNEKKTIEIKDECKNTFLSDIKRSTIVKELLGELLDDQPRSRVFKHKKSGLSTIRSKLTSNNNRNAEKELSIIRDSDYLSEDDDDDYEEEDNQEAEEQQELTESLRSFDQSDFNDIQIIKANLTLENKEKEEAKINFNISCDNVNAYLNSDNNKEVPELINGERESAAAKSKISNGHLLRLTRINKLNNVNLSHRSPAIRINRTAKSNNRIDLVSTNNPVTSRIPSPNSSAALCTCPCLCNANKSLSEINITNNNNNNDKLNVTAKQAKVLIVDDNQFIRESFKKICKEIMGELHVKFDIIEGNDGVDILSCIVANQANGLLKCTFTDENMEYFNGTEAIRIVRKLERENKISRNIIVSMTSYEDEASKDYIISAGADCIISKPYSKNQILTMLKKFSIV